MIDRISYYHYSNTAWEADVRRHCKCKRCGAPATSDVTFRGTSGPTGMAEKWHYTCDDCLVEIAPLALLEGLVLGNAS